MMLHTDKQKAQRSHFRVWQSRERTVRIWGASAKFIPITQSPYSQEFLGSWQESTLTLGKETEVRFPWHRLHRLKAISSYSYFSSPNPSLSWAAFRITANSPKPCEPVMIDHNLGQAVTMAALQRTTGEAPIATQDWGAVPSTCNAAFLSTNELPSWAEIAHSLKAAFCFPGDKEKPGPASFISAHESHPNLSSLLDYS